MKFLIPFLFMVSGFVEAQTQCIFKETSGPETRFVFDGKEKNIELSGKLQSEICMDLKPFIHSRNLRKRKEVSDLEAQCSRMTGPAKTGCNQTLRYQRRQLPDNLMNENQNLELCEVVEYTTWVSGQMTNEGQIVFRRKIDTKGSHGVENWGLFKLDDSHYNTYKLNLANPLEPTDMFNRPMVDLEISCKGRQSLKSAVQVNDSEGPKSVDKPASSPEVIFSPSVNRQ